MNYENMRVWCEREYQKSLRPMKSELNDIAFWDQLNRFFDPGTGMDHNTSSFCDYLCRRVKKLFSFLRGYDPHACEGTVLDIGCGNGVFSAEFAKSAEHVTAADISEQARKTAESYVRSRSLFNVDILPLDITSFDPEKEGWTKKFDLVFAGLVPACYTLDAIKKMEAMSRKYCFLEMRLSMTDSLNNEFFEQAGGREPMRCLDLSGPFLLLNNILSLDGCFPSVRYDRESFSIVYPNVDAKLSSLTDRFPGIAGSEEQIRLFRQFLEQKEKSGILETRREILSGWIIWDVRK